MPAANRLASFLLALTCVTFASAAWSTTGHTLRAVAIAGKPAPGTTDQYEAFLDVKLNAAGDVAYVAQLASGFPAAGVWVDEGSGPLLRFRDGQPAPPPLAGSYLAFGAFARVDAAGRVVVSSLVSNGINGLFRDSAGVDSALVGEGEPAPSPPGGTLDVGIGDIGLFDMNEAGGIVFRSDVTGGSQAAGIFRFPVQGPTTLLVGTGESPSGGGPDTFLSFGYPTVNSAGTVAFAAELTGGPAAWGLFLDAGSGPETLVTDLATAPDTGGGSYADFLYPTINDAGDVVFLANVAGGSVTAGVFLAEPAVSSIAVEGQVVPGAGPIETVSSIPVALGSDGAVALSLGFASGPIAGGVYLRLPGGIFTPVVLAGQTAPGSDGATFASFGFLGRNDDGEVAFVATLDDARTGVFIATPGQPVPALPGAALPLLATLLAATGWVIRRRMR